MRISLACLIGLGAACVASAASAQGQQQKPMFSQGECSGVLCSTIGGSQAPQNQPRKSLFPEGECGGVLCSAIGGSQAPRHAEAPPACGGGLLCDMAPYAMGQPFIKPEDAARRQAAMVAPLPPAPVPPKVGTRHRKVAKKRTAAAAQ